MACLPWYKLVIQNHWCVNPVETYASQEFTTYTKLLHNADYVHDFAVVINMRSKTGFYIAYVDIIFPLHIMLCGVLN